MALRQVHAWKASLSTSKHQQHGNEAREDAAEGASA